MEELITKIFPSDIFAGSGVIIDSKGDCSSEVDTVIFDRFYIPALSITARDGVFPIEGVRYAGEVKSTLNSNEIKTTVDKFKKIKELYTMARGREGSNTHETQLSPVTFLFAYQSDLKGDSQKEIKRIIELDSFKSVDVVCILNKGYFYKNETGAWCSIGKADGVREIVNFIGGISNTITIYRHHAFNHKIKFGNYIVED